MKYDRISTVQMGTQEAKNTHRMYCAGTKDSEGVEVMEVQKEIQSVFLDRTLSKTVFCLQTGTICVCQGATQGKSYKSTFPFDITLCKRTTWMLLLHGTMVKHAYTDTFLRGLAMFSPSVLLAF